MEEMERNEERKRRWNVWHWGELYSQFIAYSIKRNHGPKFGCFRLDRISVEKYYHWLHSLHLSILWRKALSLCSLHKSSDIRRHHKVYSRHHNSHDSIRCVVAIGALAELILNILCSSIIWMNSIVVNNSHCISCSQRKMYSNAINFVTLFFLRFVVLLLFCILVQNFSSYLLALRLIIQNQFPRSCLLCDCVCSQRFRVMEPK